MSNKLRGVLIAAALLAGAAFTSSANAAGVGQFCGGFMNTQCDRGLWCEPAEGTCGTLFVGVCVKVPQICTQIYRPVCGCNGKTFSNDCARRARRIGKLHDGPC